MPPAAYSNLLLGYYGDDFTGSTDAMEGLTRAGLRTVLFIGHPRIEQLQKYRGIRAMGIAGCSRTMTPEEMDTELSDAFDRLKSLGLPAVHYKICSTFDSSPRIGSIGRALDIGAEVFGTSSAVPLLAGAPILGRYCVFGNLFARSGLDSEPSRLDRHPTMSRHPITPMTEADLRLHLARQTQRRVKVLDVLSLSDPDRAEARYQSLVADGAEVILIDVLHPENEAVIGRLLSKQMREGECLFIVGSSGVEYALTAHWRSQHMLPDPPSLAADPVGNILVISGSCSPVTDRQIVRALEQGAVEVPLKTAELTDAVTAQAEIERSAVKAVDLYHTGKTVICHTARGPADPRLTQTVERFTRAGRDARRDSGRVLGEALGEILRRTLMRERVTRTVVTGGDTSFFVARHLGIEALEMVAPVAPGCPLCRAYVPGSPLDGIEICFKGGQVGTDNYFRDVLLESGNE